MTALNNRKPQNFVLKLCFAAEQVTESLQFYFYEDSGVPCEQVADGPLASTFNFQGGDKITIKVMASAGGNPNQLEPPEYNMRINNCSLVSIPEIGVEDISMFNPKNAITDVSEWNLSEPVKNKDNGTTTIEAVSHETLTVTAENGQWKISGYLSISQILNGKKSNKLYYFDPEGSTGLGWGDQN